MARVTVEDCLARVSNRFALTILASRRARALSEGRGHPLVECDNKEGVTALREVSGARVRFREDVDSAIREFIDESRRKLRVTTGEYTFLEAASLRALEDDDDDLEGDDDGSAVEELKADPEALNQQAKGAAAEASDDSDGEEGELQEVGSESEEPVDEDAIDPAAVEDSSSSDEDDDDD